MRQRNAPVGPIGPIGRQVESSALRADLAAALGGEGRVVWLEGEPGIGKTFLATRLAAEAEAAGADTAWGRCREQEGSPAYWPWIRVLESCGHRAGLDAAAHLDARSGRTDPLAPPDPERVRFELYDAVAHALSAIARRRPLFVVLDDLQWSDTGSLDLLAFVARELASVPALVVAAMRTTGEERFERIRSLGRGLRLSGLSASETGDLLVREVGRDSVRALADPVHRLTSGNPFFVIQVALLLASAPPAEGGPELALPPRVKEILASRLAPIDEQTRSVLQTAAVFGLGFRLGPLARALEQPVDEVLARLEAPLAAEMIRELPGTLQHYAFSHALMRDAVYEALTSQERASRHLAVARALEATDGDASSDRVFELSHHFYEAARAGDPRPAIHYACEAGERALEGLAFDEAVQQFERALAAAELAEHVSPEERVRLHVGYGIACRWTGRGEQAARQLRLGIEKSRTLGPVAFAETVLRIAMQRADFAVLDIETNADLEEALRGLPDGPSTLRAQLMARLASGMHLQPDSERLRLELSREAVEMARALGDGPTVSFALSRHLASLLTPDHAEERSKTIAEVLDDPDTAELAELEARLFQLDDLAATGDRKGLDVALAIFEHKATAARRPFFLWQVATNRTALALLEGRFAEAEQLASKALALGQRVSPQSAGLRFSQQLFALRGWQDRLPEVAPLIERSVEKTRIVPAWRCALAGFYLLAGREAEARREFEALAANDFADLPRDSTWLIGMNLLSDVCNRLGDRERAASLYRQLEPYTGLAAISHPFIVLNTPFDVRLGSLALLLGEHDQAIAHQNKALSLAERMRALPWQAETRYYLAEAYAVRAHSGDPELAVTLLEEAEAIAKPVGMVLLTRWIARAREGLQRRDALQRREERLAVATGTGGRDRSTGSNVVRLPRAHAPEAPAAAFRREGDVWSLVFEGRSTRFKHMRGLAHLARLLAEPGREFHATDLAGSARATEAGDAGEQLDAHARAEYEARLREAREDLEEARSLNDRGRADRRSEEIEWLVGELSRGFGLSGRERRAGSASERARLSVTRAIKYAIDKIDAHDPALADHLRRNVRTGTFCAYAPSGRDEVTWSL